MSDIKTLSSHLKKLSAPKIKLLFGAEKDLDNLKKKDITGIDISHLSQDSKNSILAIIPKEAISLILLIKNPQLFRSKDLDNPKKTKADLFIQLSNPELYL